MPATLISQHPLDDPANLPNKAEAKVAEALMKLGDGFVIRWGFHYTDENGAMQGEGDFLALGPDGNVLHIEVKGGPCTRDPVTGRFLTADGKNPIVQREAIWDQVVATLKRQAAKGSRTEPLVDRMLALPEVPILPLNLEFYETMPRKGLLAANDLAEIGRWWTLHFTKKFKNVEERRSVFLEVYAPGLRPDVSRQTLSFTDRIVDRHTSASFALLDAVDQNSQLLFRGGPGTGKTWFALEKAFRWAKDGKRVLFLTYNLELERMIADVVGCKKELRIEVYSYESLSKALYGMVAEEYPVIDHSDREAAARFYDVEMPAKLRELAGLLNDEHRFDALVVDEAQDHDTKFHEDVGAAGDAPGWWEVYAGMLRRGGQAPVAIFYDKYQRHHARPLDRFEPERLMKLFPQLMRVRLRRTMRYTRQIRDFLRGLEHAEITQLLRDMGSDGSLPEGPDPVVVSVNDAKAEKQAVENQIKAWCKHGECRPEDVLILYPTSSVRPDWLNKEKLNAVAIARDGRSGGIRSSSVHKAKGLEAQAVILIGFPPMAEVLSESAPKGVAFTWFMGVSRARQLLAIIERTDVKLANLKTM